MREHYRSANYSITGAALQTIDNRRYKYTVLMCITDGGTFHAARITYTYGNAGD